MKKELETMKTKLMTKLALAAAVVALGLAAQAEMLYWKATGIKSSPNTTLSAAGQYLAYIFAAETVTVDGKTITTKPTSSANMFATAKNPVTSLSAVIERLSAGQDISDLAFYNSTGVKTYDTAKGRFNTYSDGTASYDYQVGWIGKGGTVNLFAVILDGTTFENSKNYMIAQTTDGTQVLTLSTNINDDSSSKQTIKTFDWGSQENTSWTTIGSSSAPEPTSGLLLLVGLSAIALRRKKAA